MPGHWAGTIDASGWNHVFVGDLEAARVNPTLPGTVLQTGAEWPWKTIAAVPTGPQGPHHVWTDGQQVCLMREGAFFSRTYSLEDDVVRAHIDEASYGPREAVADPTG